MAMKGKGKTALPVEEAAADKALKAFITSHKGKTLTDAQKKQKAELAAVLGRMKFVRIGNKRFPKGLAGIKAIAALAAKQYTSNETQRKAIVAAVEKEVSALKVAFGIGAAAPVEGFDLGKLLAATQDEKK